MQNHVAHGQSIASEIKQAIIDYGPVVGLNLGSGNLVGSLNRIETVLRRASRSGNESMSSLASNALEAVSARERVNGTPWERENAEAFASLTQNARTVLHELFASL